MTKLTHKPKDHSKSRFGYPYKVMVTLGFVLIVFVVVGLGNLKQSGVSAQTSGGSLSGYAWSDTAGWISLNCLTGGPNGSNICGTRNYQIAVAANGALSGYAWSDNIGWVSANSSDLAGCPSAPCTATMDSDGALRGWLKAISGGSAQSGGWDGFISLSGTGYGPVKQSNGNFSGYGWGSTVVGWLSFNYASTDVVSEPTALIQVRKLGEGGAWQNSLTIEPTEEIEIGWNQSGTSNTTSCEAVPPTNNFSTGSAISGIDTDVTEPVGNTNIVYRLLCYGAGSTQKSASVTVSTNGGVGARFCPGTEVDFVYRGEDVELCWELGTNDPSLCSINAGAATVLSPLPSVTGTVPHTMFGEVTFTLECIGGDGDEMTVQVLPDVQET